MYSNFFILSYIYTIYIQRCNFEKRFQLELQIHGKALSQKTFFSKKSEITKNSFLGQGLIILSNTSVPP